MTGRYGGAVLPDVLIKVQKELRSKVRITRLLMTVHYIVDGHVRGSIVLGVDLESVRYHYCSNISNRRKQYTAANRHQVH